MGDRSGQRLNWYSAHFIIPLYSFRFLSAFRPKNRSKSGWLVSTSTRHLGGMLR